MGGTKLLYPKERFRVTYRYMFNGDIELTEEKLPLLEPQGFVKVGTKEEKDYQEKEFSVQDISQVLEADKPGVYKFDASSIKGYAYTTEYGGRTYLKPALESTVPGVTLTVVPFPEKGKPPSFNGAIGPFSLFNVSLKTPSTINVGDKIVLDVEIGGKGQLDNVPLPELCCQPGFSGNFKTSDLPPVEEMRDNNKHFLAEMRPLNASIKAVLSIEFSYFDPATGKYGLLHSQPIPITINPLPVAPKEEQQPVQAPGGGAKESNWRAASSHLPKIEITGSMPLKGTDLYNLPFGTWLVLFLIPAGALLVLLQLIWRNYRLTHKKQLKPRQSEDYFKDALRAWPDPEFYHLLNRAFMLRLAEKKLIKSENMDSDDLPAGGKVGEVRDFLRKLEEARFTGKEKAVDKDQLREARRLFDELNKV